MKIPNSSGSNTGKNRLTKLPQPCAPFSAPAPVLAVAAVLDAVVVESSAASADESEPDVQLLAALVEAAAAGAAVESAGCSPAAWPPTVDAAGRSNRRQTGQLTGAGPVSKTELTRIQKSINHTQIADSL